ncbi:unnamed protein product [Triticum turgidum subsp. durum]|uniref:F-box domain-containing protein n=1 Tax=Triticum turgidum subsp. durum TaxID=4567 RepID=A0A9R0V2M2_TRITD|nr:unnamed protein product [Triticum turgidum subsp. durum]
MPPGGGGGGGGGGGEHGSTVRRDDDAPSDSTPPLPAIVPVASEDAKKKQRVEEQQTAPSLPEGAIVEILSRLPYSSLCRFKCVSKPWLALCSARDILKRSPQTLSGFFYHDEGDALSFRNLSGRGPPLVDPSLPFLRKTYRYISVRQVCAGLLLCSCSNSSRDQSFWNWDSSRDESCYVVCNPATEEWTVLPPVGYPDGDPVPFLGFDAAVPSRFVVFAPRPNTFSVDGSAEVAIYSSETGRWAHLQSGWSTDPLIIHSRYTQVFLNDTIHLRSIGHKIATVDAEGKVWRVITMPGDSSGICDVGQSQGRLYAWKIDNSHHCQLYIWVLEDYGTAKWTLQHTINVLELFGRNGREDGDSYAMFAVHPNCNMFFLTDKKNMTLSYDINNRKVTVICTEGMKGLPYTPCFAELPSAGH